MCMLKFKKNNVAPQGLAHVSCAERPIGTLILFLLIEIEVATRLNSLPGTQFLPF